MDATGREATPGDARAIRRVARETWHAAYDDILGRDRVATIVEDWYDLDGLETVIDDPEHAFPVVDAGGLVGFAHAGPAPTRSATTFELHRLYVRPGHWDRGIGSDLLATVIDACRARGMDRLRLSVLAENDVGVSFYDAKGFDRVDEREEGSLGAAEYVYAMELG